MTYKLLTIILLIFSYSLFIKDEYTYQSPTESLYGHPGPLPEGNSGIASRYPGDVGIGSDSAVVFADDFESYGSAADLTTKWNEAYHAPNIRIAKEPGNVFHGAQALEFTGPKTNNEMSNTVVKLVSPERDSFFLRYYAKFDPSFNVLGSSHNGCVVSASYWTGEGSGPGIPGDGYNKFLASYEMWRGDSGTANPGKLNVYVYHPEQRSIWGDHFFPSGNILPSGQKPFDFGPEFITRPDIIPELGRWYCFELMVRSNTPGQRNGRIAMWLDGNVIADFPNLRLRDTAALKIDRFSIDLHIRNNTLSMTKKWVDNVVAAMSYIGPMK
jgi:hypothetical protein